MASAASGLSDSLNSLIHTPVLKDRLLTDSMTLNGASEAEEFPVSAEHSYSTLGGATYSSSTNSSSFGSDGDSMPESPVSLDDGKWRPQRLIPPAGGKSFSEAFFQPFRRAD